MPAKPHTTPPKRSTDYLWHIERIRLESARHAKENSPSIRDLYRASLEATRGLIYSTPFPTDYPSGKTH